LKTSSANYTIHLKYDTIQPFLNFDHKKNRKCRPEMKNSSTNFIAQKAGRFEVIYFTEIPEKNCLI